MPNSPSPLSIEYKPPGLQSCKTESVRLHAKPRRLSEAIEIKNMAFGIGIDEFRLADCTARETTRVRKARHVGTGKNSKLAGRVAHTIKGSEAACNTRFLFFSPCEGLN